MRRGTFRAALLLGVGLLLPAAAGAQSGAIEGRVTRLESEMRAVQRKVFPGGGGGALIQPDITPGPTSGYYPGTPASNPAADLDGRIGALESQQRQLTGQVEQNGNRIRQLEDAFAAYKRSTDARLAALEQTAATPGIGALSAQAPPPPLRPAPRPTTGGGLTLPAAPSASRPTPAPPFDGDRADRVSALERPSTGDPAEDGYLYGYRLWQAKLFPEAETALKDVVNKYPNHKRYSYARNLLGRSYLDENKPSVAAIEFYQNYRTAPRGDRAPDSLYYLAQSLVKLKKPASEVCKVYDELNDAYGTTINDQLRADVARGRTASGCR